jgi:hypothetical protein
MQLRTARLCLDCDEIHDSPQCPACASETFAYISRWVPAPARRPTPRAATIEARRTVATGKAVGYGVVGIGLMALGRWFASGKQQIEESALRNTGDLK